LFSVSLVVKRRPKLQTRHCSSLLLALAPLALSQPKSSGLRERRSVRNANCLSGMSGCQGRHQTLRTDGCTAVIYQCTVDPHVIGSARLCRDESRDKPSLLIALFVGFLLYVTSANPPSRLLDQSQGVDATAEEKREEPRRKAEGSYLHVHDGISDVQIIRGERSTFHWCVW
jgi:hypothetical protein